MFSNLTTNDRTIREEIICTRNEGTRAHFEATNAIFLLLTILKVYLENFIKEGRQLLFS